MVLLRDHEWPHTTWRGNSMSTFFQRASPYAMTRKDGREEFLANPSAVEGADERINTHIELGVVRQFGWVSSCRLVGLSLLSPSPRALARLYARLAACYSSM
jgi:hypothetical protein